MVGQLRGWRRAPAPELRPLGRTEGSSPLDHRIGHRRSRGGGRPRAYLRNARGGRTLALSSPQDAGCTSGRVLVTGEGVLLPEPRRGRSPGRSPERSSTGQLGSGPVLVPGAAGGRP